MSNKLIGTSMAVVVLTAFAFPAAASASPELTHPTGTRLAVETGGAKTKITGTNVGGFKFLNGGAVLFECSKAVLTGELTKNNGVAIEADITTATLEGTGTESHGMHECIGSSSIGNFTPTTNGGGVDGENVVSGTPWCLKAGASDTFTVRGGLCTEASRKITLILDTTLAGECKYERSNAIEGTFTTDTTGDALLTIPQTTSAFTKEAGSGVLCPSGFAVETTFTLETDSGTTAPLYIS